MKTASIISMGGYLPADPIPKNIFNKLISFLKKIDFQKEYIDYMEGTGKYPGKIETNYSGWISKPWFQTWFKNLPLKKQKDPFQGSEERRRVPFDPTSLKNSIIPHYMLPSDSETLAASIAIVRSNIDLDSIDLILLHSQIPDRPLPHNVSLVQHKLRLKNAGGYGIDTCCSTFLTMFELASSLITAGIKNNILIISSYIDSFINDKSDYYSVNTGDAAVAAIVTGDENYGYISSKSLSDGSKHDAIIFQRREPNMLEKGGYSPSYIQEFVTFYNQKAIKDVAVDSLQNVEKVVNITLKKGDLKIDEIDFLVTHQPVSWAADRWREILKIDKTKSFDSFKKYGNIATCSAPINLLKAVENNKIKADDNVLMLSTGAGSNTISLIHKISKTFIENCKI